MRTIVDTRVLYYNVFVSVILMLRPRPRRRSRRRAVKINPMSSVKVPKVNLDDSVILECL